MQQHRFKWILLAVLAGVAVAGFLLWPDGEEKVPASGSQQVPGVKSQEFAAGVDDAVALESAIKAASPAEYPGLLDAVLELKNPATKRRVLQLLMSDWTRREPEGLLVDLDARELISGSFGKDWMEMAPALAEGVRQTGTAESSSESLHELLLFAAERYADVDPQAAKDWANQYLTGEPRDAAMASIVAELAVASPESANTLLDELHSEDGRRDAARSIAARLSERNPERGLAWAEALPQGPERLAALNGSLEVMSDAEPRLAVERFQSLGKPEDFAEVSRRLAENLALEDSAEGVRWAESLPPGMARDEALAGALRGWAISDPQRAFEYFQAHSLDAAAVAGVFEEWAAVESGDAAAAATRLSDAKTRAIAVESVISAWPLDHGMQELDEWIDQMPNPTEKDQAAAIMANTFALDYPEAAWKRALKIQNADLRQQALYAAFSGLVIENPQQARSFMEKANLPEVDRAQLSELLP